MDCSWVYKLSLEKCGPIFWLNYLNLHTRKEKEQQDYVAAENVPVINHDKYLRSICLIFSRVSAFIYFSLSRSLTIRKE